MTRRPSRSLYRSLLLSLVLGLIIPALVGGHFFLLAESQRARQELHDSLEWRADLLAGSLREPLWNIDAQAGIEIINMLMQDETVRSVHVTNGSLGTFAQVERSRPAVGPVQTVERPVLRQGAEIGKVRLSIDEGPAHAATNVRLRYAALALAFQLLISLLAIYFLLRRRLIAPITRLVSFADRLATGDLNAPPEHHGDDEIGRLGKHLETMRASLKQSFDRLATSEERLRHIVEQSPGAVFRCAQNDRGAFEFVSPAIYEITGYAPDRFTGVEAHVDFMNLVTEDDRAAVLRAVELASAPGSRYEIEYRLLDRAGHERRVLERGQCSEVASTLLVDGLILDITAIKASEDRLSFMAHHDVLTGLPNRQLFNDRLTHAIDRAARNRDRVGVMFIDLDNFKTVNDTLGHNVGDRLLVEVACRLGSSLRAGDTLARLGGDEFVFLVDSVGDPQGLRPVAQKIVALLAQPIRVDEHDLVLTASVGISVHPEDGRDAETLLKNADAAMYEAKSAGRNGYRYYQSEMTARAYERMQLERELRQAIARGEIFLEYQPQVELCSGRISGVEALARWRHPEHGLVSPVRFIPLAEETGFILELGDWVLQEACRQMVQWQADGIAVGRMAVNVSVRQIEQGQVVGSVRRALAATGISPSVLQIEVTESVIARTEDAFRHLDSLRELGIGLSIDDFGTGYSSLAYLKRLPVHQIKIDRRFVADLLGDSEDEAIATAIIQLSKTLKLEVVAEGIEDEGQRERLAALGCDLGQGFLFSRPVGPDVIAGTMSRWPWRPLGPDVPDEGPRNQVSASSAIDSRATVPSTSLSLSSPKSPMRKLR